MHLCKGDIMHLHTVSARHDAASTQVDVGQNFPLSLHFLNLKEHTTPKLSLLFDKSMGESNTIVSAYTMYRHLQQYCPN